MTGSIFKWYSHTLTLHVRSQQKLKTEEYRCVRDFLCDVRLLLDNARLFYEADSEELGCVDELEQLFSQRLHEYTGHFSSPGERRAEREGMGGMYMYIYMCISSL